MNRLIGHDLIADGDGFVVLATRLKRRCLPHLVSRLGVSRAIRRGLELGEGQVVFLAHQRDQAQGVVAFGREVLLGFFPLLVRDLRIGLRRIFQHLDGVIGVLVGLGQFLFFVQVVFARVLRQ